MRDVSRRAFLADFGATAFGVGALASAERDTETPIDVFLVAGQSNASGRGDASRSPDVPRGYAYEYTGSGIEHLDDPVGGSFRGTEPAKSGSAWPAFALKWFFFLRKCVLVPVARGNTAQVAAADAGDGNWDSSGELRYTASDVTNEALEWLADDEYEPTLRGVVWIQGERDATAIDHGTITKAEYEAGLRDMIEFYRNEIEDGLSFYIDQTGMPDDGDTTGYQDVRAAQAAVASSETETYLATEFAKDFPSRGEMADRLHYTQEGYNSLGYASAKTVYESQF